MKTGTDPAGDSNAVPEWRLCEGPSCEELIDLRGLPKWRARKKKYHNGACRSRASRARQGSARAAGGPAPGAGDAAAMRAEALAEAERLENAARAAREMIAGEGPACKAAADLPRLSERLVSACARADKAGGASWPQVGHWLGRSKDAAARAARG